MNEALTPKQQAIYDFIREFIDENQAPPTLREIGRRFSLSVGTVQDQVEAIRRKGFLNRDWARARSLRLPSSAFQIPVLGRVFAGTLHAALEDVEGSVSVAGRERGAEFALRVRGDSMIEAGILEGDLVLVRRQATANDGDIVVARADDDATVKRFRLRNSEPVLEPANSNYAPIRGPFEIVGIVTEVRRQFRV